MQLTYINFFSKPCLQLSPLFFVEVVTGILFFLFSHCCRHRCYIADTHTHAHKYNNINRKGKYNNVIGTYVRKRKGNAVHEVFQSVLGSCLIFLRFRYLCRHTKACVLCECACVCVSVPLHIPCHCECVGVGRGCSRPVYYSRILNEDGLRGR